MCDVGGKTETCKHSLFEGCSSCSKTSFRSIVDVAEELFLEESVVAWGTVGHAEPGSATRITVGDAG